MRKPQNAAEADLCADKVRKLLDIDRASPLFDLSSHLARLGMVVFSIDLGPDAADAASMHLGQGGLAVLNGHLHVGRRRLAAVHELGHYLFADEYAVDWKIGQSADDEAWEARLDRFARAVLLPAHGIREQWARMRAGGDDVRTASVRTASRFRVDMSTLARRLLELGIVAHAEAQTIRLTRTTRADIVELNLVVHDEMAPPALPRIYEEAVLRLYRQETITSSRATDLLFDTWGEDDLPDLPKLPESAVWNLV